MFTERRLSIYIVVESFQLSMPAQYASSASFLGQLHILTRLTQDLDGERIDIKRLELVNNAKEL